VAVLRSLSEKNERELLQVERRESLAKLDALAEQIARAWRSPKSAVELLDQQRR
jgi:hypothetical protein